jgi:hypothetical protein
VIPDRLINSRAPFRSTGQPQQNGFHSYDTIKGVVAPIRLIVEAMIAAGSTRRAARIQTRSKQFIQSCLSALLQSNHNSLELW